MKRRPESARWGNEATQRPVVGIQENLVATLRASIKHLEDRKVELSNGLNGVGTLAGAPTLATFAQVVEGNHSKSTAADVYRAICQVAKEISRDGISKGRRNEQQNYGFRGIDDIMNALSALLAHADLIILPRMRTRHQDERQTAAGKVLFYVTVRADFDFVSARDGSIHTVTMYGEAMDSADKATNKAMSAAYKYACLQVFCIPTEGMGDADQQTHEPTPRPVAAAPRPVAQAPTVRDRQPAPWTNRGQMKVCFARIRERVGEVVYLEGLKRFAGNLELTWQSSIQAQDCYEWLLEQAVA